jgi:hypothetical protein
MPSEEEMCKCSTYKFNTLFESSNYEQIAVLHLKSLFFFSLPLVSDVQYVLRIRY